MTIVRTLTIIVVLTTAVVAQRHASGGPDTLSPAGARRLADALEAAIPRENQSQSLEEIGADIEAALSKVDEAKLNKLSKVLADLQREEDDLKKCKAALETGQLASLPLPTLPLIVDATTTPDLLAIENTALAELKLRHEQLTAEATSRQQMAAARLAPARLSPLSNALFASLDDLPAPSTTVPSVIPVSVQWPQRSARALFATGDYIGSLRHFKSIDESQLSSNDLYSMARCLEELKDFDAAVKVTSKLIKVSQENFWRERAEKFKEYLIRQGRIQRFLEKK